MTAALAIEQEQFSIGAELAGLIADPVSFSKGILGHDVWETPRQILHSVATRDLTAVKACHASSKTFTAADAALWWVTHFPDGLVVTTAPTWTQVEKLLWGNIKNALKTSKIKYPEPLKTELKLGDNNYILGISTDEGVRFQGWHGTILIILDEAPGVLPQIYEAIEGIRSGGKVHVLLLGNPTYAAGPFFEAFTKNRRFWSTFTISAFNSPNFRQLHLFDPEKNYRVGSGPINLLDPDLTDADLESFEVRPYLIKPKWVREKYVLWGPTHALWQSKVLGNFPDNAEDALLGLSVVEQAFDKKPDVPLGTALHAGIDVAGPGEAETTLYIREGPNLIFEKAYVQHDPRGPVLADLLPYRDRIKNINIDSIGIGYFFAHHIQDAGYPVTFLNVTEDSTDEELYVKQKSEHYWGLRLKFNSGLIGGIRDDELITQLTSLKYEHTPDGRILIKSKKEMQKLGFASPDRAEGLMLCYATPPVKRPKRPSPGSHSFRTY